MEGNCFIFLFFLGFLVEVLELETKNMQQDQRKKVKLRLFLFCFGCESQHFDSELTVLFVLKVFLVKYASKREERREHH